MKKALVIHPFLFAVYPIFFLFSHNIEAAPLGDVFIAIFLAAFFAFLLRACFSLYLKDKMKAGLIATIFLCWLCFYGYFFNLGVGLGFGGSLFYRDRYLVPFWSVTFILLAYFITRIRASQSLNNLTKILNFISFSLLVFCLSEIGIYKFKNANSDKGKVVYALEDLTPLNLKDSGSPAAVPDIYYIILDSYASQVTLKNFYNFDNKEFYAYLLKKGFYMPSKSASNYCHTSLSLASSLNMRYINSSLDGMREKTKSLAMLQEFFEDNSVMRFLKSKGYKYISIGMDNKYADLNLVHPFHDEALAKNYFYKALFDNMMIFRFLERYFNIGSFTSQELRDNALYSLEKLRESHNIKGPKFIFAYFLGVHDPFVFDSYGKENAAIKSVQLGIRKLYVGQMIYMNKRIEGIIDLILSRPGPAPIIILQADHGPLPYAGQYLINKEYIKQRFSIFCAFYFPDCPKSTLYDSISPVNIFRVIFNHYFGVKYDLLKDEAYLSNYLPPFKFIDVTDKLKDS